MERKDWRVLKVGGREKQEGGWWGKAWGWGVQSWPSRTACLQGRRCCGGGWSAAQEVKCGGNATGSAEKEGKTQWRLKGRQWKPKKKVLLLGESSAAGKKSLQASKSKQLQAPQPSTWKRLKSEMIWKRREHPLNTCYQHQPRSLWILKHFLSVIPPGKQKCGLWRRRWRFWEHENSLFINDHRMAISMSCWLLKAFFDYFFVY